jgi:hypothetical protein
MPDQRSSAVRRASPDPSWLRIHVVLNDRKSPAGFDGQQVPAVVAAGTPLRGQSQQGRVAYRRGYRCAARKHRGEKQAEAVVDRRSRRMGDLVDQSRGILCQVDAADARAGFTA